jgi:hypothetical protein
MLMSEKAGWEKGKWAWRMIFSCIKKKNSDETTKTNLS